MLMVAMLGLLLPGQILSGTIISGDHTVIAAGIGETTGIVHIHITAVGMQIRGMEEVIMETTIIAGVVIMADITEAFTVGEINTIHIIMTIGIIIHIIGEDIPGQEELPAETKTMMKPIVEKNTTEVHLDLAI